MKKVTTILFAAVVTTTFAVPVFAGSVGVSRNAAPQPDAQTIAELQDASQAARRDALDGNKNNLEFRRKSYEIDQLIERMKRGQQVDPADLDKAMEPARVW